MQLRLARVQTRSRLHEHDMHMHMHMHMHVMFMLSCGRRPDSIHCRPDSTRRAAPASHSSPARAVACRPAQQPPCARRRRRCRGAAQQGRRARCSRSGAACRDPSRVSIATVSISSVSRPCSVLAQRSVHAACTQRACSALCMQGHAQGRGSKLTASQVNR